VIPVLIALVSAAALEVFDFPPIWGIFDAHSLWHGATPLLSWFMYRFLIVDAHDHWRLLQRDKHTRSVLRQRGYVLDESVHVQDDTSFDDHEDDAADVEDVESGQRLVSTVISPHSPWSSASLPAAPARQQMVTGSVLNGHGGVSAPPSIGRTNTSDGGVPGSGWIPAMGQAGIWSPANSVYSSQQSVLHKRGDDASAV